MERRFNGKIIIAILIALFSLVSYLSSSDTNPITGERQHVALSIDQEIALGLQSAPEMAAQFGGVLSGREAEHVRAVGQRIVSRAVPSSPFRFQFHLLADPRTVNAFALPGGQIFITMALYRLLETEGQLAAVLGHEIGHVLERHSAQQLAKAQLAQGLSAAGVMAAYDPYRDNRGNAQVAAMISQLVTMRFGRDDELESDRWGVKLNVAAGYDPHAETRVMEILATAGGSRGMPEFFSTHPDPGNRIQRIKEAIAEQFPNGLPAGLEP